MATDASFCLLQARPLICQEHHCQPPTNSKSTCKCTKSCQKETKTIELSSCYLLPNAHLLCMASLKKICWTQPCLCRSPFGIGVVFMKLEQRVLLCTSK